MNRLGRLGQRGIGVLFFAGALCCPAAHAHAQSVLDPAFVEFESVDHNTLSADGTPLILSYSLAIYRVGDGQPSATASLGKPAPDSAGKFRVGFLSLIEALPAGVTYEARVTAVAAAGSASSSASNTFAFQGLCGATLSASSQAVSAAGLNGSFAVSTGSGCAWSAVSTVSWVTLTTGMSGNGPGMVGFTVAPNALTTSRTGTITAAGQTFTLSQAGVACTYSISPGSQTFPATGGSGSVSVTAGAGCTWSASNNASWVTVNGTPTGSGDGTVTLSAAPNTGTTSRSGTMTVAGRIFTLTEAAAPSCSYTLNPTSASETARATSASVTVTTSSGCAWTPVSTAPWLTVTGSGSGAGSFTYRAAANETGDARTGTVQVGPAVFSLTQKRGGAPQSPKNLRISAQ